MDDICHMSPNWDCDLCQEVKGLRVIEGYDFQGGVEVDTR